MVIFLILLFQNTHCLTDNEVLNLCNDLFCDEREDKQVCGVRYIDGKVTRKLFDNECKLLQYGCSVNKSEAYGLTDIENCEPVLNNSKSLNIRTRNKIDSLSCPIVCPSTEDEVCCIRTEGTGFVVRTFANSCQLTKYNCEHNTKFYITDKFICLTNHKNDYNNVSEVEVLDEKYVVDVDATTDYEDKTQILEIPEITTPINVNDEINENYVNTTDNLKPKVIKQEGVIVVDAPLNYLQNINSSIDNFFASTHVFDLPLKEIPAYQNPDFRRVMIRVFGPVKVYKPWVTVPKNISDGHMYAPTLSSCYHRCPTECPDSYAPVCGQPGSRAREPSIMFQNHCYMDAAQCKMFWDDASDTAESAAYIESSFVFCLGDTMNAVFRFLPLIRTLQHMGRLKKKGKFRSKLRNMRFFNEMIVGPQPKFMGKK